MKIENKSKIIIISLVVLVIILSGFLGYTVFINKKSETKTEIYQKVDNTKKNDNVESNKLINFKKENCINCNLSVEDVNIYRLGTSVSINGLSLSIGENEKNVKVQANYAMMYPDKYTEADIINSSVKTSDNITLEFDKNVEFIFGGCFASDSIDGTVFIFLLEDGSLEYMKYSDIYESKNYTKKSINDVSDIVRFDNIVTSSKNGDGSTYMAIAYKIDGTYYDLTPYIK